MHLNSKLLKPLISRLTMKKKFPEAMGEKITTGRKFYCYIDKYEQHWLSYSLFSRRDYIPKDISKVLCKKSLGEKL
jgi:hypothetical protein